MSKDDNDVIPLTAAKSASPRTILVLGGGGMKGIAHIGVWKALEEAGVHPDGIVGTSMGAVIGSCLAGGMSWRELAEVARELTKDDIVAVNRRAMWIAGLRQSAIFSGSHFREYLERTLPVQDFAKLKLPLQVNAVSLVTGEPVWFGSEMREEVPIPQAVYASCAIPIYFPPAHIGDDVLVDGGVLDVLPLRRATAWDAERIIGVDVGAELLPPEEGYFDRGMIAIHDRVLNLNLQQQRARYLEAWTGPELLYIRPKIGHLSGWDFERTQFLMEEGYRAAREALAEQAAA
jgi:NTE family protein